MGKLSRGYCRNCEDFGPAEWDPVSHLLHLFLSLLTLGLWLPVWIWIGISGKRRCRACGSVAYSSPLDAWLHTPLGMLALAGGIVGIVVVVAIVAGSAR